MMPGAGIYIPLQMAHDWSVTHRGPMSQVALALALVAAEVSLVNRRKVTRWRWCVLLIRCS